MTSTSFGKRLFNFVWRLTSGHCSVVQSVWNQEQVFMHGYSFIVQAQLTIGNDLMTDENVF